MLRVLRSRAMMTIKKEKPDTLQVDTTSRQPLFYETSPMSNIRHNLNNSASVLYDDTLHLDQDLGESLCLNASFHWLNELDFIAPIQGLLVGESSNMGDSETILESSYSFQREIKQTGNWSKR